MLLLLSFCDCHFYLYYIYYGGGLELILITVCLGLINNCSVGFLVTYLEILNQFYVDLNFFSVYGVCVWVGGF